MVIVLSPELFFNYYEILPSSIVKQDLSCEIEIF